MASLALTEARADRSYFAVWSGRWPVTRGCASLVTLKAGDAALNPVAVVPTTLIWMATFSVCGSPRISAELPRMMARGPETPLVARGFQPVWPDCATRL